MAIKETNARLLSAFQFRFVKPSDTINLTTYSTITPIGQYVRLHAAEIISKSALYPGVRYQTKGGAAHLTAVSTIKLVQPTYMTVDLTMLGVPADTVVTISVEEDFARQSATSPDTIQYSLPAIDNLLTVSTSTAPLTKLLKAQLHSESTVNIALEYFEGELVYVLDNPNYYGTAAFDLFGNAVAANSELYAVAAHWEDSVKGYSSGKVYVYHNDGRFNYVLNNPTLAESSYYDLFGTAIAMSETYLAVGSILEGTTDLGIVYVYNAATGRLLYTIENPRSENIYFGASLAIDGNKLLVGHSGIGDTIASRVHLYNLDSGQLIRTIVDPNASTTDAFGKSLSLSGDYAVVGAPNYSNNIGQAYLFNVASGSLVHTITNQSPVASDRFGYQTAINNEFIAITKAKTVYLYSKLSGELLQTITTSSYSSSYNYPVYLNTANQLIIGKPGETDGGRVAVYNAGLGTLTYDIPNPNAYGTAAYDQFGTSICATNSSLIVGASSEDEIDNLSSGKAYIFTLIKRRYESPATILRAEFTQVANGSRRVENIPLPIQSNTFLSADITHIPGSLFSLTYAIDGNDMPLDSEIIGTGFAANDSYIYFTTRFGTLWQVKNVDNARYESPDVIGGVPTSDPESDGNNVYSNLIAASNTHVFYLTNNRSTPEDDHIGIIKTISGGKITTEQLPGDFDTTDALALSATHAIIGQRGQLTNSVYAVNLGTGLIDWALDNPEYAPDGDWYVWSEFGNNVAISGDYLIVGARLKIYVYNINTQELLYVISEPEPSAGSTYYQYFGNVFAAYADTLVINAPGVVHVWNLNTQSFVRSHVNENYAGWGTIPEDDILLPRSHLMLSKFVGVNENYYAIVGVLNRTVDIYSRSTGELMTTLENPNIYTLPSAGQEDRYGVYGIEMTKNTLVVPAPYESSVEVASVGYDNTGVIYVYQL